MCPRKGTMRALVLSGGGSRGAYQVGVLRRWMSEEGRDYDILCGTSVGAINVAALSQVKLGNPKRAYRRLAMVWDGVSNAKIRKWWWFWYLSSIWRPSIYNSEPLRDWIKESLDAKAVAESGRIVRVGAVSWETGEEFVATESDPELQEWVYSSASFPLAFKPGTAAGGDWTDWGLRTVTPIGAAIKAGATEIDVITTFNIDLPMSTWTPKYRGVAARGLRALDIMMNEIMRGDLRAVGDRNALAELGGPYRKIKLNIKMPSKHLDVDSLDFNPKQAAELREFGHSDAT